jgi:hypothetical protein
LTVLLIASAGTGRFAEHLNVGYTVADSNTPAFGLLSTLGGNQAVPDEVKYAAGVEFVATPRLTVIGDVIGRILSDAGRLRLRNKSFQFQGTGGVETAQFDEFDPQGGNLNLLLGTVGAKFNPVGDLLLGGSILFPLTDAGLRSRLTTVLSLDYAF